MNNWPTKSYIRTLEKMSKEQLIECHIREAEIRNHYQTLYNDLRNDIDMAIKKSYNKEML